MSATPDTNHGEAGTPAVATPIIDFEEEMKGYN